MPELTTQEFDEILRLHGPKPKPTTGPRPANLDLPKAGPVRVPANLPQLPPVQPVQPVRTTPQRGQNPATVAAIDSLLNEQVTPTSAPPRPVVPTADAGGAPGLTDEDFARIAQQHGPRAAARQNFPAPAGGAPAKAAAGYSNQYGALRHPGTAGAYLGLIGEAKRRFGYRVELRSGDRDGKQQASLYHAPGNVQVGPHTRRQAKNGYLVAEPGFSPHERQEAVDVVVYDAQGRRVPQSKLADLAREFGFEWLGPKDPPHFTYRPGKKAGQPFRYQSPALPPIPTAESLLGALPTGAPEPAIPRPPAALSEEDFARIAQQHGPRSSAELRQYATDARLGTGRGPAVGAGFKPATNALLRGETYGPPVPPTPQQESERLAQRRQQEVLGPNSYSPYTRTERRSRNAFERVTNSAAQMASTGARYEREAAEEWERQVIAGNLPGFASLDPKKLKLQVAQLNQLQDKLARLLNRRIQTNPAYSRDPQGLKKAAHAFTFDEAAAALDKELTPWQRRNLYPALGWLKWGVANSDKTQGGYAIDIGLGMLGEGIAAGVGRVLGPGIARIGARAGKFAPVVEGALRGGAVGAPLGAIQGGVTAAADQPNLTAGQFWGAVGQGGLAGGGLGLGLGAGGGLLGMGAGAVLNRVAANATQRKARTAAPLAGMTSPVDRSGISREVRRGAAPPPTARLHVDRGPQGRFVVRGTGTPIERGPVLETPAGPLRVTPGVEVAAPGFSRATFRVEEVLPGNRVRLRSVVNGTRLETTVDRIAPPTGAGETLPAGPLDTLPGRPSPTPLPAEAPPVDALWARVQAGEATGASGQPNALLQAAKLLREAGHVQTPEEFAQLRGRVRDVQRQGLTGRAYQDAMRRMVNDFAAEAEGRIATAEREAGNFTYAGKAGLGKAAVTQDGRIRRSPTEKPLTLAETEDLLMARRFLASADDSTALDWLQNTPEERTNRAFTSIDDPNIRQAVEQLEAQRQAQELRGLQAAERAGTVAGTRGRSLVQEAYHYANPMAGGYRNIDEIHQRPELLDEIFRTLNTPSRASKMYQTQHGSFSLRDLIYDLKMLPPDAARRQGGLRAQAAAKELAGVAKAGQAAPEPAAPTGRRVTLEVDGQQRTADLTPEQARQWEALEAEQRTARERVRQAEEALRSARTRDERNIWEVELQQRQARAKSTAMQTSARKRELAGTLTAREQQAAERATQTLVPGRTVETPQGRGEVVARPAYGKVKVRLASGEEANLATDAVRVAPEPAAASVPPVPGDTVASGPSRLEAATAARQAAQAEFDAALKAAHNKHGGKLLSGGIAPDPEAVRDYLPVMRALVKLGYTSAKELEAAFLERVTNASAKFAAAVREALEREDGPLGARAATEGAEAAKPATVARPTEPAKPARAGVMNLSRFQGEEAQAQIWQAVEAQQAKIATQTRGRRTGAETRAAAEAMGLTLDDLRAVKPGAAANAETLEAVGGIVQQLADEAARLERAYEANPTPENLLLARAAHEELLVATATFRGQQAEAGRALGQLGRIRKAIAPRRPTVEEIVGAEAVPANLPEPGTAARPQRQALPQFAQAMVEEAQARPQAARGRAAAKAEPPNTLEKPLPAMSPAEEARLRAKAQQQRLSGFEAPRQAEPVRPFSPLPAEYEARLKRPAMQKTLPGVDAPTEPGAAAKGKGREWLRIGAENRLVTEEKAAAALDRLTERFRNLPNKARAGTPETVLLGELAEALPDLLEVGLFVAEAGYRSFPRWSKQMRGYLGDRFTDAQLRPVYDKLRAEATKRLRQEVQRDEQMRRLIEELGGANAVEDEIRAAAQFRNDPLGLAKYLMGRRQPTATEKILSYWRVGLTMGPGTHLRNTASGLLSTAGKAPVDILAAAVNRPTRAVYQMLGKELGNPITARDAVAGAVAGFRHGLPAGARRFGETMRHGLTQGQAEKLDLPTGLNAPGGLVNPYNLSPRWQAATDQFFKGFVFESERAALAMRQALAENRRGSDLSARIAELMEDTGILDRAEAAADYYTFNAEPGSVVRWFQRGQRLPYFGPALQFVSPFVRVVANVGKKTVHHSPLGLARLFTGVATAEQASQVIAQAMFGTMVWGVLYNAATDENLTGAAPTNPKERAAFYDSGREPYSIKIGGRWWRYSGMGDLTSALATVAATKTDFWDKGKPTPTDRFMKGTREALKSLQEQSFLAGLFEVNELIGDTAHGDFGKALEKYAAQQTVGVLPLSGLLRALTRATDPVVRDPQNYAERVKAATPGFSQQVPAKIDPLGREVRRNAPAFVRAFGIGGNQENSDPLSRELRRLGIHPSPASAAAKKDGKPVKLTPEQERAYQAAVGTAMAERAEKVFASPYYRSLKADETRGKALGNAMKAARQDARLRFLREHGFDAGQRGGIGLGGLGLRGL